MNKRQRQAYAGVRGMTLIEMLITIGIIALLASLVAVVASTAGKNARRNEAKSLLQTVQGIAVEYQSLTRGNLNKQGWVVNHSVEVSYPIDWESPEPDHKRTETDLYKDEDGDGAPDDPRWLRLKIGGSGAANDSDDEGDLSKEPTEVLPAYLANAAQTREKNNVTIERFVWAVFQLPETHAMLANLSPKYLADTDGDDFIEIIDPWGEPLFYAAYVDHGDNTLMDDFLVERKTWTDKDHNPAAHRSDWKPVFASSGEDRLWGKEEVHFADKDTCDKYVNADPSPDPYTDNNYFRYAKDNLHSDDNGVEWWRTIPLIAGTDDYGL